jgi:hypothetical protein
MLQMRQADFDSWLAALAGDFLGHGCYSEAYLLKSDPSKILKVSKNRGPDMAAYAYLKACSLAQPLNAPRVFQNWLIGTEYRPEGVTVSIQERLRPVYDVHGAADASDQLRTRLSRALDAMWIPGQGYAGKPELEALNPSDVGTFRCILAALRADHRFYTDLHAGNAMVRSNGVIVITDPVAGS